jgi:hypothetical protein
MGMTDSQFKSYVRLLLELLIEAKSEESEENKNIRLDKIIKNLQATLED